MPSSQEGLQQQIEQVPGDGSTALSKCWHCAMSASCKLLLTSCFCSSRAASTALIY